MGEALLTVWNTKPLVRLDERASQTTGWHRLLASLDGDRDGHVPIILNIQTGRSGSN